ncbi:hypothetical protein NKH18_07215 [Streptomyces sp. M10(2022)]
MSDNPQISAVLAYVEARERELSEQAGQLRSRIEDLTAHLGELDAESENLRITRKTLLAIPDLIPSRKHPPRRAGTPGLPADPRRPYRRRPSAAGPRPVRGTRPADPPEEHRRHPVQAETPGHTRHPHRTRTRPVHSAPHLTSDPIRRPGNLTQLQVRKGITSHTAL